MTLPHYVPLQLSFSEDENGHAYYVMSIVHNAASYIPDLLDHMAEHYPNLTVKNGVLGRNSDIESTNMANFKDQVILVSVCLSITCTDLANLGLQNFLWGNVPAWSTASDFPGWHGYRGSRWLLPKVP